MLLLNGPTELRLEPRREAEQTSVASGFALVETGDVTVASLQLAPFRGDAAIAARLRRLLEDLGPRLHGGRLDDSAVFEAVAQRLASGDLVLLERRRSLIVWPPGEVVVATPREVEEAEVTPPPPAPETTWIEIQLVDEDDQPIAGEKYRIELPDGTTAEGALDAKGLARVSGIEPGSCQITFPELDQDLWESA